MGMTGFFQYFLAALRRNYSEPSHVKDIQNQRFRRLVKHAVLNSEFYRELYRGIDIDHCGIADLPIVTKADMMENFDRFVTDSRLKLHELTEWTADKENFGKLYLDEFIPVPSSGSTGKYALAVYNRHSWNLNSASMIARSPLHKKRSLYHHAGTAFKQLLGGKRRIAIMTATRGNVAFFLKAAPPFHRYFMELLFLSVLDPIEQNISELNEFQPVALIANSSFLPVLAQEQLSGRLKIKLDGPASSLAGFGEPLPENAEELALKAWGKGLQNIYGAAECLSMATSCQITGQLHAMNDLCIIESVDEDFSPVPDGKYGEKILATNLTNFTLPIIRYEIDDIIGYTDKSCKCGLPYPTLLPIQGRKWDFFYFQKSQGGYERIHPYSFSAPLFYFHELKQYQIVQTARNELTVLYVLEGDQSGIEDKLQKTLQEVLENSGLESRVTLVQRRVETISREPRSGKYKPFKSSGAPVDLDGTSLTKVY